MSHAPHPSPFRGLSAYPLTPVSAAGVREADLAGLVRAAVAGGADAIGLLGSTGSGPYLSAAERERAVRVAVAAAGPVPVTVGIGALRTDRVLANLAAAQAGGAAGVLLAPISYHPLSEAEVLGLFRAVSAAASVPIAVYDNPGTTRFRFRDELLAELCALPGVRAVKLPGVPEGRAAAAERIAELRTLLPGVTLTVSRDWCAADALAGGCDGWSAVLGGVLPGACAELMLAARAGDEAALAAATARLEPLFALVAELGGLRVAAAAAVALGLLPDPGLPAPLLPLGAADAARVAAALLRLG